MRRTPRWNSLAGAALALALAPAFAPAAPAPSGPAADKDKDAVNPVEKLRKDLDKTVTIKFDKTPLPAALDQLRDKTKLNLYLDTNTIQQMGFTPDQLPVDGDFKDAKVRGVLRAILAPNNLGYAPIGDAVIVTTEDMAVVRQLRQRISVDMTKVEFATAVRQIAKDTAVNLIVDSRVEKQAAEKVTLQLEDVPLETAVRLLAEMAGLKPVRVGNVLFITSKENANELRNDPDVAQPNVNAQRQAEILQQQIQLQLGAQAGGGAFIGGLAPPPGVAPAVPPAPAAPPGVAPAVPPGSDTPKDKDEASKPDDKKPADPAK